MNFRIDILSKELEYSQIKAYIVTPADQIHPVRLQERGHGTFTPDKMGMHEIVLDVDDVRYELQILQYATPLHLALLYLTSLRYIPG